MPASDVMAMVHVYTGNGKGKTTAALGLALRAVGCGMKVAVIQFLKGDPDYCELKSLKGLGILVEQHGRKTFVNPKNPANEDIELAHGGLTRAKEVVKSGKYNLVILDEINIALDCKLVELKDVIELIRSRPDDVELVLTGRNANKDVVGLADYVTEMKEIKHPFNRGVMGRKGIEF